MALRAVVQGSSVGGGQTPILFQDEGVDLGTQGTVDTIDFTGAGVAASRIGNKVTVNVSSGGGGAPTTATYLTLSTDATLTNERVLTQGTNIAFVDGGAGGALTLNVTGTDLSYTAGTRLLASSTGADATLPLVTSTEAGLAPLSGGGTTNFLRADATWAAPPGTDLTYTAATRLLASSTGADATLPLFSSADAGLAPASGGGTANFLRADGTWAAPGAGPGGGLTHPQVMARAQYAGAF